MGVGCYDTLIEILISKNRETTVTMLYATSYKAGCDKVRLFSQSFLEKFKPTVTRNKRTTCVTTHMLPFVKKTVAHPQTPGILHSRTSEGKKLLLSKSYNINL